MKSEKGMNAQIWILLVVIILLILGIVLYFVFSGDSGTGIIGGSNIPSPPPLPE